MDTKMILPWNSLMISGLARAYIVFREAESLEIGIKTTDFILKHQFVDSRLHRLNYDQELGIIAQSEEYGL
ncbi:MAG: hypothetical protein HRU34_14520 [Richelia sp.]|nr:hypothetical protein [Richelia sp.]